MSGRGPHTNNIPLHSMIEFYPYVHGNTKVNTATSKTFQKVAKIVNKLDNI